MNAEWTALLIPDIDEARGSITAEGYIAAKTGYKCDDGIIYWRSE